MGIGLNHLHCAYWLRRTLETHWMTFFSLLFSKPVSCWRCLFESPNQGIYTDRCGSMKTVSQEKTPCHSFVHCWLISWRIGHLRWAETSKNRGPRANCPSIQDQAGAVNWALTSPNSGNKFLSIIVRYHWNWRLGAEGGSTAPQALVDSKMGDMTLSGRGEEIQYLYRILCECVRQS